MATVSSFVNTALFPLGCGGYYKDEGVNHKNGSKIKFRNEHAALNEIDKITWLMTSVKNRFIFKIENEDSRKLFEEFCQTHKINYLKKESDNRKIYFESCSVQEFQRILTLIFDNLLSKNCPENILGDAIESLHVEMMRFAYSNPLLYKAPIRILTKDVVYNWHELTPTSCYRWLEFYSKNDTSKNFTKIRVLAGLNNQIELFSFRPKKSLYAWVKVQMRFAAPLIRLGYLFEIDRKRGSILFLCDQDAPEKFIDLIKFIFNNINCTASIALRNHLDSLFALIRKNHKPQNEEISWQ